MKTSSKRNKTKITFGFQDSTTVNSSELYTAILSALLVNKFFTLSLNLKAEHNTARLLFSSNESAHSTPLKKKLLTGQFEKTNWNPGLKNIKGKSMHARECVRSSVYHFFLPIKAEVQTPVSKERGPAQQRMKAQKKQQKG